MITGLKRISRPGRASTSAATDIRPVVGGLGISILTTPRGVMTRTRRAQGGVGGEVLCNVW